LDKLILAINELPHVFTEVGYLLAQGGYLLIYLLL